MNSVAPPQSTTNRLYYEWWMLCVAESILDQSEVERETQNAWIESSAIHARNLAAFFYDARQSGSRADDVFAEDLIPRELWRESRPDRPFALTRHEFSDPVNKQIAHLTQCADPKKEWDFSVVTDALQPALEAFLTVVDVELLGDRWSKNLRGRVGPRWDGAKRILLVRAGTPLGERLDR